MLRTTKAIHIKTDRFDGNRQVVLQFDEDKNHWVATIHCEGHWIKSKGGEIQALGKGRTLDEAVLSVKKEYEKTRN